MNTNAKIICDFGDERFRIAAVRLENDISVRTNLHTVRIVVRIPFNKQHGEPETTWELRVQQTSSSG